MRGVLFEWDIQNMQQKDSWLLPDGIEEILPEEAKHLESLRR